MGRAEGEGGGDGRMGRGGRWEDGERREMGRWGEEGGGKMGRAEGEGDMKNSILIILINTCTKYCS